MTKVQYIMLLAKACRDGIFPSVIGRGCRYRGENGKKCAIGVLIPDEVYQPQFDDMKLIGPSFSETSMSAHELDDYCTRNKLELNVNELVDGLKVGDLAQIQHIHDTLAQQKGSDSSEFIIFLQNMKCFKEIPESVWMDPLRLIHSPKQTEEAKE